MIKFKIWQKSGVFKQWVYFFYKKENGIGMVKNANNSFAKWTVGSIPDGAIIC